MSDWKDVMRARDGADAALDDVNALGGQIEDGREANVALALCLCTRALCQEVRALAVLLDFARGDAR